MIAPLSNANRRLIGIAAGRSTHRAQARARRVQELLSRFRLALGASELDEAYRVSRAPILAVSGSNFKCATACLLARMIHNDVRAVWPAFSRLRGDDEMTILAAARNAISSGAVVAQVDAAQLSRARRFCPAVTVITSIVANDDRAGGIRNAVKAAERLVRNAGPRDIVVMNAVNVHARRIGRKLLDRGVKVIWFDHGPSKNPDTVCISEGRIIARTDRGEFVIGDARDVASLIPAESDSILAAAAAALAFGVSPEAVTNELAGGLW